LIPPYRGLAQGYILGMGRAVGEEKAKLGTETDSPPKDRRSRNAQGARSHPRAYLVCKEAQNVNVDLPRNSGKPSANGAEAPHEDC
jgi:hypothetical protein